ncbi:PhyR family response regulator anti-anti-sigma factor [Hyphomonas johnsonii]|jgi:CheY-like chemotaxis protein|uniref:Two-component response regulator n=1 Tax=Hyphomonas johnsonii MHS-2 TaxID=1280950 RepID=A0A059FNI4_9PROT|nr:response regulator [Hyphomonas johnsonii]KCZ92250.1 two-component response regulator [Hyphomonas johnsonii MHS-2]
MLSDLLETQLPYLRRYARAVTGARDLGDQLVSAMIEARLLGAGDISTQEFSRITLFQALDDTVVERMPAATTGYETADPLGRMAILPRRALMLRSVEGFTRAETAAILGLDEAEVDAALADAEAAITQALVTNILIIEDEPMIAAHLAEIVRDLGHSAVGIANTYDQAVDLAANQSFGLVLADIHLADGSSGIDAVNKIRLNADVPVIYITAYPEKLCTGTGDEPVFLIPKPFEADLIKAVISQALLGRH